MNHSHILGIGFRPIFLAENVHYRGSISSLLAKFFVRFVVKEAYQYNCHVVYTSHQQIRRATFSHYFISDLLRLYALLHFLKHNLTTNLYWSAHPIYCHLLTAQSLKFHPRRESQHPEMLQFIQNTNVMTIVPLQIRK